MISDIFQQIKFNIFHLPNENFIERTEKIYIKGSTVIPNFYKSSTIFSIKLFSCIVLKNS